MYPPKTNPENIIAVEIIPAEEINFIINLNLNTGTGIEFQIPKFEAPLKFTGSYCNTWYNFATVPPRVPDSESQIIIPVFKYRYYLCDIKLCLKQSIIQLCRVIIIYFM